MIPLAQLQLLMREPMFSLRFQLPEPVQVQLSDEAFELAMPEVEWDDVLRHFIEVGDLYDLPVVGPVDDVGVVMVLNGGKGTSRSDYSLSMKFPIFAQAFIFENSIIKQGKEAVFYTKGTRVGISWGWFVRVRRKANQLVQQLSRCCCECISVDIQKCEESFEVIIQAVKWLEARTGHAFLPLSSPSNPNRGVYVLDIIRQNIVNLHHLPKQLLRPLSNLPASMRSEDLDHRVVDQL